MMRKYQLTMKLSVLDGSRTKEEGTDLNVYVDGNDIWGVICGCFKEIVDTLVRSGKCRPVAYGESQIAWK